MQDVSRPRWAPSRPCCSGRAPPADASTPRKTKSAPVADVPARLPQTHPRLRSLRSLALDSACACAPRNTEGRPPNPARRNPLCRRCPPSLRIIAGTLSSTPSFPRILACDVRIIVTYAQSCNRFTIFTVYCCYHRIIGSEFSAAHRSR